MKALRPLLFSLFFLNSSIIGAVENPELNAPTLDGQTFSLSEHRGKVVLIDFWATWCPPCRSSLAHYASLHERYGAKGLVVVAITSEEDEQDVQRFVEELSLPFTIIHDASGQIASRFAPPTLPTAFLVDQQGALIETFAGFKLGDEKKIDQKIAELLGEEASLDGTLGDSRPLPIQSSYHGQSYRYWSYGLWSTGAVLLGASGYIYLGPLQDSIETRDTNYQLWQNTAPSPQFESFERAFLDAEGRAEKQEAWAWILAGAGLTSVVAGFVTWFSSPIDVAPEALTVRSNLRMNVIPRLNTHNPGLDIYLSW